jgi:hypothetical protein
VYFGGVKVQFAFQLGLVLLKITKTVLLTFAKEYRYYPESLSKFPLGGTQVFFTFQLDRSVPL